MKTISFHPLEGLKRVGWMILCVLLCLLAFLVISVLATPYPQHVDTAGSYNHPGYVEHRLSGW